LWGFSTFLSNIHVSVGKPDELKALNGEVVSLIQEGQYDKGTAVARKALALAEKTVGHNHPETAVTLNNLASLYDKQGQYALAEPLFKRALEILDPSDPAVGSTLTNLAILYVNQGRHALSEPLFKDALKIMEKVRGPDHPDVAQSLNNLAPFYRDQGEYGQAEPLLKRALGVSEKTLGARSSRGD